MIIVLKLKKSICSRYRHNTVSQ